MKARNFSFHLPSREEEEVDWIVLRFRFVLSLLGGVEEGYLIKGTTWGLTWRGGGRRETDTMRLDCMKWIDT